MLHFGRVRIFFNEPISIYGDVATHRPFGKVLAALPTSGGDRSHIYGVAAPEVGGGRVVGYLEGPIPHTIHGTGVFTYMNG